MKRRRSKLPPRPTVRIRAGPITCRTRTASHRIALHSILSVLSSKEYHNNSLSHLAGIMPSSSLSMSTVIPAQ